MLWFEKQPQFNIVDMTEFVAGGSDSERRCSAGFLPKLRASNSIGLRTSKEAREGCISRRIQPYWLDIECDRR